MATPHPWLLRDTNEQHFKCTGVRARPVIPETWMLRQNDCKFKACLGNWEIQSQEKKGRTNKQTRGMKTQHTSSASSGFKLHYHQEIKSKELTQKTHWSPIKTAFPTCIRRVLHSAPYGLLPYYQSERDRELAWHFPGVTCTRGQDKAQI